MPRVVSFFYIKWQELRPIIEDWDITPFFFICYFYHIITDVGHDLLSGKHGTIIDNIDNKDLFSRVSRQPPVNGTVYIR